MNKVNLVKQRMALQSVDFKRFEASITQPRLIIVDEIKDAKFDGKTYSFVFERHANFEPESLFSIKVSFIYIGEFSQDTLDELSKSNRVLSNEELIELGKRIVNNTTIASNASLIIANNTSVNGGSPLLTPPQFINH